MPQLQNKRTYTDNLLTNMALWCEGTTAPLRLEQPPYIKILNGTDIYLYMHKPSSFTFLPNHHPFNAVI